MHYTQMLVVPAKKNFISQKRVTSYTSILPYRLSGEDGQYGYLLESAIQKTISLTLSDSFDLSELIDKNGRVFMGQSIWYFINVLYKNSQELQKMIASPEQLLGIFNQGQLSEKIDLAIFKDEEAIVELLNRFIQSLSQKYTINQIKETLLLFGEK